MDLPASLRIFLIVLCTSICMAASSSQQKNNQQVNLSPAREVPQNEQYFFYQTSTHPKDCKEVQQRCSTANSSGVYFIKPDGIEEPFEVFCDHDVDTGGWTVIQRRENDSVNFNRSWSQYREGFGFISTEFWLGNEKISYLTNQAVCELRIDVELFSGNSFYTTYKGFRISDDFGDYKLCEIGTLESDEGSSISTCPTNTKYGECICQTTCQDPNGESACYGNCSGSEGCICPAEGYKIHESGCIHTRECGCFLPEENMVLPDGDVYVNENCSRRWYCNDNVLNYDDITCDINAACVTSDGMRQCSCNEGYNGDGHSCDVLYTDCNDVYEAGNRNDGAYTILPSGWTGDPFRVLCKIHNGGGWTVFQHRIDGFTDFYKDWNEYKIGFGDLLHFNGDFWLGNDKLHYLTNQKHYKLRVDVTTSDGSSKYAEYSEFQIESEETNYKMNKLGSRSGTTGSNLYISRGKQFSTRDRDNDNCGNFHCAEKQRSGWWHSDRWCASCYIDYCHHFHNSGSCYNLCTHDNLNGDYNGGNGQNILTHDSCSWCINCNLMSVEMKILPSQ